MRDFWFGFGHVMQWLLSFLVKLDWLPVIVFTIVMAIGAIYWLMLQNRFNQRAKEKGEHI
ncbi:MAG: hypothetical protein WAU70_15455 [Flavobacteriales bacterium]